jgi:hypothetical protein
VSDVSVLSHEYQTASDLSRTLNEALIILKKTRLALPGAEAITTEERERSRHCLANILDTLLELLAPADSRRRSSAAEPDVQIPGALVAQLRAERQGDLAYYLEDLEHLAERLRAGVHVLTEQDLSRLDELAAVADAEASSVFRRLMRK